MQMKLIDMARSCHASFCLAALAIWLSTASASCTNYTAQPNLSHSDGSPYTAPGATKRVSEVINCTGSAIGTDAPQGEMVAGASMCEDDQCWIGSPSRYYIEAGSVLNVSTSSDTYNSIMKLMKTSVEYAMEVDWNGTSAHAISIDRQGVCIDEPGSGYLGFTPYILCTEGVLTGCSGDGPTDNTPIRACGNVLLMNGMYQGEFHSVMTGSEYSESDAAAPPNATIPDNSGNVPGNAASSLNSFVSGTYILGWIVVTAGSMMFL